MKINLFPSNSIQKLIHDVTVDIRKLNLNPKTTIVVNVDVINGFFKEGALASLRLDKIIGKIEKVNEFFLHSQKIFFIDSHTQMSTEFSAYPTHCVSDREQQIVSELSRFTADALLIKKNCTNGFLEPEYARWFAQHRDKIENIVITGGATDICVMQFALTQKAYLNEINSKIKVIAVENAIQTFDTEAHNGDMCHAFAMYNMYINGIIPVKI